VTPILMIGGAYLCFEATEKIVEAVTGHDEEEAMEELALSSAEKEKEKISHAIRTDLILSAEIMAISLAQVADRSLPIQAAALFVVGVLVKVGVYGVVGLIVKMDDIGLHMAKRRAAATRAFGRGLVKAMPVTLKALALVGTAAMLWVGGGIIVHGLHEYHFSPVPGWVEGFQHWAATAPGVGAATGWLAYALGSAVVGLVVGGIIVAALHLVPRKEKAAH
jgi:predicted DNA repair protein MutK